MRVGVDVPYFRDPLEIREFAQGAEALGVHHLAFSEHVAATRDTAFPSGFRFDDPWHESFTLLGFLAAATTSVELCTSMLLVTLRPAVLAAKQAAEIDLLSRGRLRLGVSVGWNTWECAALGLDPSSRGAVIEEQIEVMRRLWTEDSVSYAGRHVQLREAGIHPRPDRSIPIWMGGGSFAGGGYPPPRVLDRAARLADGFKLFAPLAADRARSDALVRDLRDRAAQAGRDPETFGIEARLVPQALPEDEWAGCVAHWKASGVSHLGLANRIAGGAPAEQLALVERFVERTREHW